MQIAIVVDACQITGPEPTVGCKNLVMQFRSTPVPRKHGRSTYLNGSDHPLLLVWSGFTSHCVDQSNLSTPQWEADRPWLSLTHQRVGRKHRGLSHPVALKDDVPRPSLERFMQCLGHRSGTRDEQPHSLGRRAIDPCVS